MRLTKKDKIKELLTLEKHKVLMTDSDKLGQLEDVLEKYGIEDIETLDNILNIVKFLNEHDYTTMPKEDFDALFKRLEELENEVHKNKVRTL